MFDYICMYVCMRNPFMQAAEWTMDGIIDTVSAVHPMSPLVMLLKNDGKLIMIGAPRKPIELEAKPVILGN